MDESLANEVRAAALVRMPDMRRWWIHCPKCDVAFTIDGIDRDIEDPDDADWIMRCPYDDAPLSSWNGDPA